MNTRYPLKKQLEEFLDEVKSEIYQMPNQKNPDLRGYAISQAAIKGIISQETGPSIVKIGITLTTQPIRLILQRTDEKGKIVDTKTTVIEDWYSYWMLGMNPALSGDRKLSEKAVTLQEFMVNIRRNFPDNPHTNRTYTLAEQLRDKLALASLALDEKDYFSIKRDIIRIDARGLPKPHSMQAIDLIKTMYVKPNNYATIKKHEDEGKFNAGIPLELEVVTYAILE